MTTQIKISWIKCVRSDVSSLSLLHPQVWSSWSTGHKDPAFACTVIKTSIVLSLLGLGPRVLATPCKYLSFFPTRRGAQIWCNTQELQMPAHVTIKVRKDVSFTKLLSTQIFFPKSGLFPTDTFYSSWFYVWSLHSAKFIQFCPEKHPISFPFQNWFFFVKGSQCFL